MDEVTELLNNYAEENDWKPGAKYRVLCKFIAEHDLLSELEDFLEEDHDDDEEDEEPLGPG